MLRLGLGGRDQAQQLVLADSVGGRQRDHLGLSAGERAGLVQDDGVGRPRLLETNGVLEEDAPQVARAWCSRRNVPCSTSYAGRSMLIFRRASASSRSSTRSRRSSRPPRSWRKLRGQLPNPRVPNTTRRGPRTASSDEFRASPGTRSSKRFAPELEPPLNSNVHARARRSSQLSKA
jgi:hypothetical protein